MKEKTSSNALVYITALISFIITYFIMDRLGPFESGSTQFKVHNTFPAIWYCITMTGFTWGAIAILLLLIIYLWWHFKKISRKCTGWLYFIIIVVLMHLSTLIVTQYYIKDVIREPRPFQKYLQNAGIIKNDFYEQPDSTKKQILDTLKNKSANNIITDVDTTIWEEWHDNTNFSFPSGHSQNSFFIATIVAFVLYKTCNKKRWYFTVIPPFIWAVLVCLSRDVLGCHYPCDIGVGAFIGILIAFLLLSMKEVNEAFDS